jgi:hypothetical protein
MQFSNIIPKLKTKLWPSYRVDKTVLVRQAKIYQQRYVSDAKSVMIPPNYVADSWKRISQTEANTSAIQH